MSEELDCQKCGACCADEIVLLMPGDDSVPFHMIGTAVASPVLKGDEFVQLRMGLGETRCMRVENRRCVALSGKLGADVTCEIYENRPKMCAGFDKGTDACMNARRKWYLE